jgi:hypothetical protein
LEEWNSSSFWWTLSFNTIGPGFSRVRATALARKGFQYIRDVLTPGTQCFISSEEAHIRFGLLPCEFRHWDIVCSRLARTGSRFLIQRPTKVEGKEWVGLYVSPADPLPLWVVQGNTIPTGQIGSQLQVLHVAQGATVFSVLPASVLLTPSPPDSVSTVVGFINRIRVETVTRGPKKKKILLFFGKTSTLTWDPSRVEWSNGKPFMSYTTKMGCDLLRKRQPILDIPSLRWGDTLPMGLPSSGKLTGTLTVPARRPGSFGRSGIAPWPRTIGVPALLPRLTRLAPFVPPIAEKRLFIGSGNAPRLLMRGTLPCLSSPTYTPGGSSWPCSKSSMLSSPSGSLVISMILVYGKR